MTEDPINLVLIVKEEKDQAFYQSHLASYEDIELEVFPSFLEFRNQCHGKLYSGFLVDIRTLIRSAGGEKLFFSHLMQFFPVMRVKAGVKHVFRPGGKQKSGTPEGRRSAGCFCNRSVPQKSAARSSFRETTGNFPKCVCVLLE